MKRGTRKRFDELMAGLEPRLRRAFAESVDDIKSAAQKRLLEEAIAAGDIERVLRVLQLGPEFFRPLDDAMREAFIAGGVFQLQETPPIPAPNGAGDLVIRFNGRTPRAEAFAEDASRFVVEIVEDQRDVIRATVRDGIAEGRNPRATARQLVGQVNRATGRRTGGVVGLDSTKAAWVRNMDAELRDPDLMANYFTRERRDRRFDSIVRTALDEGRPLSDIDRLRITGRYSDRLLALRGETIARTETLQALNAGRVEGIEQIIERGNISRDQAKMRWSATLDSRTRDSHENLNNQTVTVGQPFVTAGGARLRYPGDTSLGAPASEVISCRCYAEPVIDFLAEFR